MDTLMRMSALAAMLHIYICLYNKALWGEALRVAWEEGRLAHVVKAEEEHDNALHADATAGVRRTAVLEGVYVGLDLVYFCNTQHTPSTMAAPGTTNSTFYRGNAAPMFKVQAHSGRVTKVTT